MLASVTTDGVTAEMSADDWRKVQARIAEFEAALSPFISVRDKVHSISTATGVDPSEVCDECTCTTVGISWADIEAAAGAIQRTGR